MSASVWSAVGDRLVGGYRTVYWFWNDRRAARPFKGVRTVVAFGESLGDNLLCTRVLEGLHLTGAGPVGVLTPDPDLFVNMPFPVHSVPFAPGLIGMLERRGHRLVMPTYGRYDAATDRFSPTPRDHLIAELCRSAGLTGQVELKPIVRLTDEERASGVVRAAGHVVVQTSCQGGHMPSRNKDWPIARWQMVTDALRTSFPITQIGAKSDPLLDGAIDLRGALSVRETAAVLAAARLFLGGEGFLMHLARAVDCRAVIVLGGRTAPHQTCYVENANLFTPLPCAPCWRHTSCDFGRECLDRISPQDVLAAVADQLAQPPLGAGQRVDLSLP